MAQDVLSENGDLAIVKGDFAVGYSDQIHVQNILLAEKGQYRESPLVGVGIRQFLASPVTSRTKAALEREIKLQLEADGAIGSEVSVNSMEDIQINNVEYP